jgi:hypothetical protein
MSNIECITATDTTAVTVSTTDVAGITNESHSTLSDFDLIHDSEFYLINGRPHIYFEDQWQEVWPYRYKN